MTKKSLNDKAVDKNKNTALNKNKVDSRASKSNLEISKWISKLESQADRLLERTNEW